MYIFNISKLGNIAMTLIMNPQTESDYDPLKPPSVHSTPELLNIQLIVKSGPLATTPAVMRTLLQCSAIGAARAGLANSHEYHYSKIVLNILQVQFTQRSNLVP